MVVLEQPIILIDLPPAVVLAADPRSEAGSWEFIVPNLDSDIMLIGLLQFFSRGQAFLVLVVAAMCGLSYTRLLSLYAGPLGRWPVRGLAAWRPSMLPTWGNSLWRSPTLQKNHNPISSRIMPAMRVYAAFANLGEVNIVGGRVR